MTHRVPSGENGNGLEFKSRNSVCVCVCVCVCVYGGGQISSLLTRTCLICGIQVVVFEGHLDLEVKKEIQCEG